MFAVKPKFMHIPSCLPSHCSPPARDGDSVILRAQHLVLSQTLISLVFSVAKCVRYLQSAPGLISQHGYKAAVGMEGEKTEWLTALSYQFSLAPSAVLECGKTLHSSHLPHSCREAGLHRRTSRDWQPSPGSSASPALLWMQTFQFLKTCSIACKAKVVVIVPVAQCDCLLNLTGREQGQGCGSVEFLPTVHEVLDSIPDTTWPGCGGGCIQFQLEDGQREQKLEAAFGFHSECDPGIQERVTVCLSVSLSVCLSSLPQPPAAPSINKNPWNLASPITQWKLCCLNACCLVQHRAEGPFYVDSSDICNLITSAWFIYLVHVEGAVGIIMWDLEIELSSLGSVTSPFTTWVILTV